MLYTDIVGINAIFAWNIEILISIDGDLLSIVRKFVLLASCWKLSIDTDVVSISLNQMKFYFHIFNHSSVNTFISLIKFVSFWNNRPVITQFECNFQYSD